MGHKNRAYARPVSLDTNRRKPYDSPPRKRAEVMNSPIKRDPLRKPPGGGRGPTWLAAALGGVLLLAASGCGPAAADKLVGTWQLQSDGGVDLLAAADVRLTFEPSGKLEVSTKMPVVGTVAHSGTWKFLSIENNQLRVETRMDGVDRTATLDITIVDDQTIRLVPPTGPVKTEARFRRVSTTP
jgi:hypothetical protein